MRVWLYGQLKADPGLGNLEDIIAPFLSPGEILENRVTQGESLSDRLGGKPFIFYTIGNATDERLSETSIAYTQFFQIYVHDVPADYQTIDKIVKRIIKKLHGSSGQATGYDILNVRYLETSRDLDDVTLGTIMRYIRFQATVKEYTDC